MTDKCKKIIESQKNTYNLIFSIGEACSCTEMLRLNGLQINSYPFDWLFGSDYIGRCKILASYFERFIKKTDLEFSYEERSIKCNAYHNLYNDITFNHDFDKNVEFNIMYTEVKSKYERRIARLLKLIKKSKRILVVYIEIPSTVHTHVSDDEILKGYEIIKNSFPSSDIDLLYVKNTDTKTIIKRLNNHVTLACCDYKDKTSELDYCVDFSKLNNIMCNYKLKPALSYRLRRRFLRLFISLILSKKKRRELKEKLHV